jgi:hypothetical protein
MILFIKLHFEAIFDQFIPLGGDFWWGFSAAKIPTPSAFCYVILGK